MQPAVSFDVEVTPESFSRWRMGRDDSVALPAAPGARVPLPFLVFLRAQPALGVDFHELLGRDPDRGLYGGVSYRQHAPLGVGQWLSASGSVKDRKSVDSARGRIAITTFVTEYRNAGILMATEEVRMIDLPAVALPPNAGRSGADKGASEPAYAHLADLPPLTRRQIAWLTVSTGDTNALHLDGAYARERGYPDVVAPATLLNALFEREIAQASGHDVVALDVRYHAATFPGDSLRIHADLGREIVPFQALVGSELRAEGRAMLQRDE